jgi:hypothetical protein
VLKLPFKFSVFHHAATFFCPSPIAQRIFNFGWHGARG